MKKQKVCVELSKVYDSQNDDFTGVVIGERGCFSNDKDFKEYNIYELFGVVTTSIYPYLANTGDGARNSYMYYIPLNKANFEEVDVEPSYRKLKSIDEFEAITQNHFGMGEPVIIRDTNTLNESELIYGGYFITDENKIFICLGAYIWSFDELFEYEFHINNSIEEWKCFGVKE